MKTSLKPNSIWIKEPKLVSNKSIKSDMIEADQKFREGLKMVDTVKVRFNIKIETDRLEEAGWERGSTRNRRKGRSYSHFYKKYTTANGNSIKARYRPCDFSKQPNFSVEFSATKVALGNNHQIRPGEGSIKGINKELKSITDEIGISPLDIMDGFLTRIDIANNWKVDKNVKDYIRYLAKCSYSRRTRTTFRNNKTKAKETGANNGVSFYSNHSITKAYDKYDEAGAPESQGILRLEVSTTGAMNINSLFGKKRPKFSDITESICRAALQNEIEVLGLDHPIIGKKCWMASLRNLVANGLITKGMMQKLYGFIIITQDFPNLDNQALADLLGISTDTIGEYRKKLTDGGISVLGDLTETLPVLSLDNPEPLKNSGEVLSNTSLQEYLSYGETMPEESGQTVGRSDPGSINSLIWSYRLFVKTTKTPFIIKRSVRVQPGMLPWPPSRDKLVSNMLEDITRCDLMDGKVPSGRSDLDGDPGSKSCLN